MVDTCLAPGASGDLLGLIAGGNALAPLSLVDGFLGNFDFFKSVVA